MRFDLKTPGRDAAAPAAVVPADAGERARAWLQALGGPANVRSLDACTTRLRLTVADQAAVDADALRRLGARGVVRPAAHALQVVVGTMADQLAEELRQALPGAGAGHEAAGASAEAAVLLPAPADPQRLAAALGGRGNVRCVEQAGTRVRIQIEDAARLDTAMLGQLSVRGVAYPQARVIHLILGPAAAAMTAALRAALERPSS